MRRYTYNLLPLKTQITRVIKQFKVILRHLYIKIYVRSVEGSCFERHYGYTANVAFIICCFVLLQIHLLLILNLISSLFTFLNVYHDKMQRITIVLGFIIVFVCLQSIFIEGNVLFRHRKVPFYGINYNLKCQ